MPSTLILGGARSGKSSRAQSLAEAASPSRIFIATAEPMDDEMAERIARHQQDRGEGWRTVDAPLDVSGAIKDNAERDAVLLVDCLTLWLSNLMHYNHDVEDARGTLCSAIEACRTPLILVSNEIGLGLVPETELGRRFRDAQGRLNQSVAKVCDRVEFVAAGLPVTLKG